jgi:diguanylate cyclase (GGDEF)-like protein
MGHTIGDELLKQVASRLKNNLREEDTIARLGGDEFIILISNIGKDEVEGQRCLQQFTDKVLHLFKEEFEVNEQLIKITTSIGLTMLPQSDATPEELLQKSDVAMYEAKSAGRNKVRQFLPEMQQLILNEITIEKDLRKALRDNEFELYYQPLFDDKNNIFSVEALIRWNHAEKGDISPVEFIELAERRGLIIPIGDWVMEQALNDLSVISDYMPVSMSINVSAYQFGERLFVDKLKKLLAKTSVNPNKVRLEITESMVMDNVEKTIEKMKILAKEGISFSIDDFGTGHSSLAYLKRLPVNLLKIDKSFVLDITNDSNDALIVDTILAMAHHMEIDVIAEGVETVEVLDFLKSKGCRKFQGYLFDHPMPFKELLKLISYKLRQVS